MAVEFFFEGYDNKLVTTSPLGDVVGHLEASRTVHQHTTWLIRANDLQD